MDHSNSLNSPSLFDMIRSLENEITYLESEIEECISNKFFSEAELFQQALEISQQQLYKLKKIEDPGFFKQAELIRKKNYVSRILDIYKDRNSFSHDIYLEEFNEIERQLLEISNYDHNDESKILREKLADLLNSGLKILRITSDKITFNIERTNEQIILEIKSEESIMAHLTSHHVNRLFTFGFVEKLDYFEFKTNTTDLSRDEWMKMLSIIFFEIFQLEGNNDTELLFD